MSIAPLHTRTDFVIAVAKILSRKSRPDAVGFWMHLARRVMRIRMACGASREATEAEMRDFLRVVLTCVDKIALAAPLRSII